MNWIRRHPDLTTWAVLGVGMLVALGWSARDQALTLGQWFWLAFATVGVAGLCAWIISWEADEPDFGDEATSGSAAAAEPEYLEGKQHGTD